MYRTGDLGRRNTDGLIEFIGRQDSQVKVRGFLVELAEVEAALADYPGLAQVVVLAREFAQGDRQLVGYVVPEEDELDFAALRAHAGAKLPDYMVPAGFVRLDSLPLTANGKLDRRAMPEPEFIQVARPAAPETPLQQALCGIFSAVLNVPEVGIYDSFLELGGQSLHALRLLNRINALVGIAVSAQVIFDFPTVAELAAYIDAHQGSAA